MESVFLTHPAVFAFLGAFLLLFGLMAFLPRARFLLFFSALFLAMGAVLTFYFLGSSVLELLLVGLLLFLLSMLSMWVSKKVEEKRQ